MDFKDFQAVDLQNLAAWAQGAIIRGSGKNTCEEVQHAFKYLAALSSLRNVATRVIVVSSPAHVPRCFRDASRELHEHQKHSSYTRWELLAAESSTGFGSMPENMRPEVTEPESPLHPLVARCLELAPDKKQQLYRSLDMLLRRLEGKDLGS